MSIWHFLLILSGHTEAWSGLQVHPAIWKECKWYISTRSVASFNVGLKKHATWNSEAYENIRVEASCHFPWAFIWSCCNCKCHPAWTATQIRHWMRGWQQVCFAKNSVTAHRLFLLCSVRSAWHFGKRRSSGISKSVSEGSETGICDSTINT